MGVSLNWLKQYVDVEETPEVIAHRLSMAGILVEGLEEKNGDIIMDLDLTPNRGDCLGMINLAREVSALNGRPVRMPEVVLRENAENIEDYIQVEIEDPDLCPRYTARVVKNCVIGPSPDWMQQALINSGIRPINNIVDVTNYVMLETNQPLHAFDYRLLGQNPRIVVRRAKDGETLTTLDEVERQLDSEMLLITDGQKPIALAGVMGGLNTEINDDTRDVLLESANFLGTNIRKTARKLAMRSESSMRFEKGLDINGVIYAVNRAAQLLQDLAGGEVVSGICDCYPQPVEPVTILLRPQRVNQVLGTDLGTGEIKGYMNRLGLAFAEQDDGRLLVQVPSYRVDLTLEADLIEEVARLYGYDNIPSSLSQDASCGWLNPYQKFRQVVTTVMARYFNEVINYSFINPIAFDMIMLPEDSPLRQAVRIANPLSEEQSVMRTLLLPGLLKSLSTNLARRNMNLSLFETGMVFRPGEGRLPDERLKLGAIVCGRGQTNWMKHDIEMDYYYLKGMAEILLEETGCPAYSFAAAPAPGYHPGRTAAISCKGEEIGIIGELHPAVLEAYGIKERACAMEIDLDKLYSLCSQRIEAHEIPRYPAVERDLALLLEQSRIMAETVQVIREAASGLLEKVTLFDVYVGEQVPAGYKSLAFRLTFQSYDRTLTDAEVNAEMEAIRNSVQARLQATIR
ncbi:MAG: phenylalanine--tRNA ligase subunit beta [Syntrophomonadaceae bacterium]|jgi:phenylalanyl-tRNA synthetase beta chain|nr:phenylalanine--tRNA ligase subunit beta [Syntrophomonadaceae bacterium]